MRRSDEAPRRPGQEATPRSSVSEDLALPDSEVVLSKTQRKHAMLALQDLGERLVELIPARLASLALPERLSDAIVAARKLTGHEARRRQMQYVGRLMREVDPAPIEAELARWAHAPNAEKARLRMVERWRERLLSEAGALDAFFETQPLADRAALQALIARAAAERARGSPPHAYRELFRVLNALLGTRR
ncbi:MAG TPA: ribosome biogenesis factor YjgA [Casimicrobiaceae bacterium]|jgi:ribosome-associated protein